MIISCLENEYTSRAVCYTLDFILNCLGFFYEWIRDPIPDNQNKCRIVYGDLAAYQPAEHTLILPKIYPLEELHKLEPDWKEITLNGNKIPVLGLFQTSSSPKTVINFDLIATIYLHLVRIEELGCKHPDEIDEIVNQAILYKYGRFKIPVVDIIINWFGKKIEEMLTGINQTIIKKGAFPHGEQFGLALTHDIDLTRTINPLKRSIFTFFHRLHFFNHQKFLKIQESEKNIWGLDDLLDLYKEWNWQATFNFIPRLTEGSNYRYNIMSRKFRKLFRRLKSEGHEIGFHPSRDAFNHPGRYKREFKKLRWIVKDNIYGLRHHYLRCLFPQIWTVVQSLNLKYDCSLAYRRIAGFRAGTTRVFSCFDHLNQREIACSEFSTPFFEESLPDKGREFEKSFDAISSIIRTISFNQGVLTVLWHPNNMYQQGQFRKLWEALISLLRNEETFLAPLRDHLKWQRQRQQIYMKDFQTDHKIIQFRLHIPENVDSFTLHLSDVTGPVQIKNGLYKIEKEKGIMIIQPEADAQIISIQFGRPKN